MAAICVGEDWMEGAGGGDVVVNIVYFAFAASSWAFTSFRHFDNCGYLLSRSSDFAFTTWRIVVSRASPSQEKGESGRVVL